MPHRSTFARFLGIFALALALAAVSAPVDAKTAPARATIRLLDNAFDAPNTISGPLVDIVIVNDGKVAHELAIGRLRPGTTIAQVTASIKRHERNAAFVVDDPGGVSLLGAGERLRYQRVLEPGLYEIFCPMPMPDGTSHAQHGMVRLVTVTKTRSGTLPRAEATITLTDKAIMLGTLMAGTHTIAITNRGTKPHELSIVGVAKPSDLSQGEQMVKWIEGGQSGPPPINVTFPGGQQSIKPGVTVNMTMMLQKGRTYHFDDTGDGSSPLSADLTLR